MKNRIISFILASALLLSFGGCAKGNQKATATEPEEYSTYYFERFGDEVMPIGAYYGPTLGFGYQGSYMESQITPYHFQQVADCGINFVIGINNDAKKHHEEILNSLQYCEDSGIMYIVKDDGLFLVNESNAADPESYLFVDSAEEFAERVREYTEYDSFAGISARDEPWANMFPQLNKILEYFNDAMTIIYGKQDHNKLLYVNSNALQCPSGWFGSGSAGTYKPDMDYQGYLDEWYEYLDLGYYSYDTYAFTGHDDHIREDIFENYSIARINSEKNGMPFWVFMQAGGDWDGNGEGWRLINEGEMLWQVNTALAYGCKGYSFYPYNVPPETVNTPENGTLVGRNGQKSENWFYAQKANKQTAACDHILMKSTFKGIIHTKSGKQDTTNAVLVPEAETNMLNGKFREITGITGDNAITGCFNYQGKTVLYVVNNSITLDKAKITVNLNGNYGFSVIQRAETRHSGGSKVELTFAPGEGALVILDY